MKKRSISIIGSPWAKGLKKKETLMRMAAVFAFSILHAIRIRLFTMRHMFRMRRERKNERKRTRRRKETPWRHRPETELFQMRRKREDREHERGITNGRTPTMPARTTNVLLHKAANLLFRNLSMCDTVWYDMARDRALPLCETQIASNCDTLNSRIFAMFLNYFDKSCAGIFLVRLTCISL